jgi:hypothetical protein
MFALEDQIAGSLSDHAVALGEPTREGAVVARVAARPFVAALGREPLGFARVIAEPDLVPPPQAGWHWCGSEGRGFVRRPDGSAFAVGGIGPDRDLPVELAVALAQCVRAGAASIDVVADVDCDDADCARWAARSGVPFKRGAPWQWTDATRDAFTAAIDLAGALRPPVPPRRAADWLHAFVPAVAILAIALAVHVLGTTATWAARRMELARSERALVDVAAQMGVTDATPANAAAAIARAHSAQRHRAGLWAVGDAVPVLAQAVPALAALPPGSIRSAAFATGAWTFELANVDDAALDALLRRLVARGLPVVHARQANGVRLRVGPPA